jgi:hypothetical protein
MLDPEKIVEIVEKVARSYLDPQNITKVLTEPAIDSAGHDALRITIVIEPGATTRICGDAVLDTLVQIQNRLQEAGESRFPIIEYSTRDELENSGDRS